LAIEGCVTQQIDVKSALRRSARMARDALDPTLRASACDRIAAHTDRLLADRVPRIVAGYAAIGSEIDPAPTMLRLASRGWILALPVIAGRSVPLTFRRWAPGDALAETTWGIREPLDTAPIVTPDVLLVPLLAADRAGHRLGYGGGYYDRTIAALTAFTGVFTIGIAFAEQIVDVVPTLAYDRALDRIVTPCGVITPQGSA
jgi:5-formyltetrahydrofolate cyclo-ligase